MFKYRYLYHRPETEIEAGVCVSIISLNNLPASKKAVDSCSLTDCLTDRDRCKEMLSHLKSKNPFCKKSAP